jgi:hypothetical protein
MPGCSLGGPRPGSLIIGLGYRKPSRMGRGVWSSLSGYGLFNKRLTSVRCIFTLENCSPRASSTMLRNEQPSRNWTYPFA